jgi:hypothetical protein
MPVWCLRQAIMAVDITSRSANLAIATSMPMLG